MLKFSESLEQGFSTRGDFVPSGTSGNVWGHSGLSQLRVLLASHGQRPGMLKNIPQCPGRPLNREPPPLRHAKKQQHGAGEEQRGHCSPKSNPNAPPLPGSRDGARRQAPGPRSDHGSCVALGLSALPAERAVLHAEALWTLNVQPPCDALCTAATA